MNLLQDDRVTPLVHAATREGDEGHVVGISVDSIDPFDVDIMENKRSRGGERVNLEVVERAMKKGRRLCKKLKSQSSKRRS